MKRVQKAYILLWILFLTNTFCYNKPLVESQVHQLTALASITMHANKNHSSLGEHAFIPNLLEEEEPHVHEPLEESEFEKALHIIHEAAHSYTLCRKQKQEHSVAVSAQSTISPTPFVEINQNHVRFATKVCVSSVVLRM